MIRCPEGTKKTGIPSMRGLYSTEYIKILASKCWKTKWKSKAAQLTWSMSELGCNTGEEEVIRLEDLRTSE